MGIDVHHLGLLFFLLIGLALIECRGGRGGGRFGGRYSRGRYSSVRSRYSTPTRYKYSGYRLSSSTAKKAAILAGTVYGARLWMRRSSFRTKHYYPEVCYNDVYVGNTTVHYYGRFVCPGYSQPESYKYCCGNKGSQKCCDDPFDSSSAQGVARITGIVIGSLGAVILIGVVAYCIFKNKRSSSRSSYYHSSRPVEAKTPTQPEPPSDAPPSYDKAFNPATSPYYNTEMSSVSLNGAPYPTEKGSAPYPTAQTGNVPYPPHAESQQGYTPYPQENGFTPTPGKH